MPHKISPKIGADGGESDSPYVFIHPNGWPIANCIIRAKSVWLLRQAAIEHGNFKSADEATRPHIELLRATPMQL